MRSLPIGVPKVMVSSVASGDVKPYVGPSDICMMYSVTDVAGINRISERVLANAAHALAGMIAYGRTQETASSAKPAIGLTMFGVTTPCVQTVVKALEDRYDCLVFHATGTGGQSMEKLVASGLLAGVIDVTTTEIADEIVGGVLSAGPSRLDAIIGARLPYVGSCGALDMVNFWAMDTVPAKFQGRNLYRHNSNVTLMRTTPEECARIGRFIVDKLNRMEGPVRFLIPEGGVSLIDAAGKPFWDPDADRMLFDAIGSGFRAGTNRKLVRLPHNINDQAFCDALVASFEEIAASAPAGARVAGRVSRGPHRAAGQPQEVSRHDPARRADHRRRRGHGALGQVRGGRRHRPHRHLQLRALPHGGARVARRAHGVRQRQRDRAGDGARGAARREAARRCWRG